MKRTGLNLLLLLPLLSSNSKIWKSAIECCWKKSKDKLSSDNVQITTTCAFRIIDGYVWKAVLGEKISEIMKSIYDLVHINIINKKGYETYEHLNIHLFNSYKYILNTLFENIESSYMREEKEFELELETIRWVIKSSNERIKLEVYDVNNEWDLLDSRVENFNFHRSIFLLGIEPLNDDIVIATTIGLLIYHFNENNKTIYLNYFYYTELYQYSFRNNFKIFLRSGLPLPNYDSFKISDKWVSYVKDNKESLLKYGVELLTFAIKEQKLELIEEIYKKCIKYFKEDLRNNRMFLSIITSTMPLLDESFPDYILRYSLETTMIIDRPQYNIEYQCDNSHLHSFQYPQIINLSNSILWLKYNKWMGKLSENHVITFIIIQLLIILLILPLLPIYFVIFYILSKYHFIINIHANDIFSIYFKIIGFLSKKLLKRRTVPIVTFMVPYIKFVNYPREYNWFWELISPQPSPFFETISSDIYKTLDGAALINFKWNTYGKYYHRIIWIGFMSLLGCFNAAAGIPKQYIDIDIRNRLLIASIILGIIHLSFEIRQFIYNPAKWIRDVGSIIGILYIIFNHFIIF
jgi:hypothetical protein